MKTEFNTWLQLLYVRTFFSSNHYIHTYSSYMYIYTLTFWFTHELQAPTGDHENLIERRKQEIKSRLDLMWNYCKAAFLIILGTAMTLFLGSPLMQSIQAFADGAGIPSFLVSYSIVPLALNYKSAISSIKTALEKTEKALSLTFCEVSSKFFSLIKSLTRTMTLCLNHTLFPSGENTNLNLELLSCRFMEESSWTIWWV